LFCAAEQPGGLSEEHKYSWLLLQLDPKIFGEMDIFSRLARTIVDENSIECGIILELDLVRKQLGCEAHIFCVIDEAQFPASLYAPCLLWKGDPKPVPVLYELIRAWSTVVRLQILSGTGVSTEALEVDLRGKVAVFGPRPPYNDVGAFDAAQEQQHYLEQYLPLEFLQTESGQHLMTRVTCWLRGRYVEMLGL
jgi:hypothetical protein